MATTVTVTKGLIGKEDINFEAAGAAATTFERTAAGGGTQLITKITAAHIPLQDANSRIDGTNVESALQEIALEATNSTTAHTKGADIASAATIALPSKALYFDVTGTTDISDITIDTDGVAGRMVVLQFDGVLTVKDGSNIALEGDFITQAGDHLLLIYDGSNWRELARTTKHGDPLHGGPFRERTVSILGPVQITTDADEFFDSFAANNPTIHDGPFEARDVEHLGPVQITSPIDAWHSRAPLNGFIGGQTESY